MTQSNINPSDPKKLTDADLTQVSGGKVPDEFMGYLHKLPESTQGKLLEILKTEGERRFLFCMADELHARDFRHEAAATHDAWEYLSLNGHYAE